jgi:hypothetical protein
LSLGDRVGPSYGLIREERELGRARLQPCGPEPIKTLALAPEVASTSTDQTENANAIPQWLKPALRTAYTGRLKAVPFPMFSKLVMNNPGYAGGFAFE